MHFVWIICVVVGAQTTIVITEVMKTAVHALTLVEGLELAVLVLVYWRVSGIYLLVVVLLILLYLLAVVRKITIVSILVIDHDIIFLKTHGGLLLMLLFFFFKLLLLLLSWRLL